MGLFKKQPKYTEDSGTALFVNEVGAMNTRIFKQIESQEKDKVILDFGNNEKYVVPRKFIRTKRILIYKTSSGKVVCQNPDNWSKIDLNKENIKELRFNLLNFSNQESKAALHRWSMPQSTMDKLMPLFKLLFICIAVGVIGWSAFKFGGVVLDKVVASRLLDCNQLIPHVTNPVGAVVNATSPIG